MWILAIISAMLFSVTFFLVKDRKDTEEMGVFWSIFGFGLGLFGLYLAYVGDIAINGIKSKSGDVIYLAKLQSRTEIFFDVNIHLFLAIVGYIFVILSLNSFLKAL